MAMDGPQGHPRLLAAVLCVGMAAGRAGAATIIVTSVDPGRGSFTEAECLPPDVSLGTGGATPATAQADGMVTLREAICLANNLPGADTIELQATTYVLTGADNFWYGPNGLPPIASEITIEGRGATIARDASLGETTINDRFRLFFVSRQALTDAVPDGTLTLRDLTLKNGLARGGNSLLGGAGAGIGGAILNQGSLTLERATFSANTARGGRPGQAGTGSSSGAGIGADSNASRGGGFGPGPVAGGFGGAAGGPGISPNGGGGAGFGTDPGATPDGGGSGSVGGNGSGSGRGFDGGGGGGGSGCAACGNGGGFGFGGVPGIPLVPDDPPAGGGGIGGGGGGATTSAGPAGGGGFGGGGGYSQISGGAGGGFGAGGAANSGLGGFAGGDGTNPFQAGGAGGGLGGAIFNHTGSITAIDSRFVGNRAEGGDVPGAASPFTLSDGGAGLGGAIFNLDGAVSLTTSTLVGNVAAAGLGGTNSGPGANGDDGPAAGGAVYNRVQDPHVTGRFNGGGVTLDRTVLTDSVDRAGAPVSDCNQSVRSDANSAGAGVTSLGSNLLGSTATVPGNGAKTETSDPCTLGGADAVGVLDFGDAPDPGYPTLLASDGARHGVSPAPTVFLGTIAPDGDPDGQPSTDARGDDAGSADEDGVVLPTLLVIGTVMPVDVRVAASGGAQLDAWIDWNRDGDWNDPGEQVASSLPVVTGLNTLGASVPTNAASGPTYARFRLSSSGALAPTGPAADGEVEDYQVVVGSPTTQVPTTGTLGLIALALLVAGVGLRASQRPAG